jgi:hypothetical protein
LGKIFPQNEFVPRAWGLFSARRIHPAGPTHHLFHRILPHSRRTLSRVSTIDMIAFSDPSLHETNSRLRVRRSIQELIQPTRQLAVGSAHLFYAPLHPIDLGGDSYVMPRFLFVAPNRGARLVRVGIFAGIHGDEIAGCHAALQLLQVLHENPELGRGYELFVYPVCNPTGYEDGTRFNRRGVDLNREFWKKKSAS